MKQIDITAKFYLTDIGGHEHTYEDVSVKLDTTLYEDRFRLNGIAIDAETTAYLRSVGTTATHWMNEITGGFDTDPDHMLQCITDNMDQIEWNKVEEIVTLYNSK